MFTSDVKLQGAEPSADIEPTLERVSAVHQVLTTDACALCGFLTVRSAWQETAAQAHLLRVRRLLAAMELPGPRDWWAFVRVYRTTLLLLDVAPPEIQDNYEEMVRSQSVILERRTERDHAPAACRVTTPLSCGLQCSRLPSRTIGGELRTCMGPPSPDLTRIRSAATAVGGGTAQPALEVGNFAQIWATVVFVLPAVGWPQHDVQ